MYWLSRYIERVENTARLAQTHSQLMLDMPKAVGLSWYTLIEITGNEDFFDEFYDAKTEKNCCLALLADRNNSASLISSLWWARENVRTTRDSLPSEAWIYVNELYLLVKENMDSFAVRKKRNELLEEIIRSCQAIIGMLEATMSYNETYQFIQLGNAIERADMTSRILDVGAYVIARESKDEDGQYFENILWANILKSQSALFMYRQAIQIEINGISVIRHLINDPNLFRSINHCVGKMHHHIGNMPPSDELETSMQNLKNLIDQKIPFEIGSPVLHEYLDKIQIQLSQIHQNFYDAWFHPKIEQQMQMQQ